MGAIIWKELRENLKWAVLWMSAVGAAMVYALSQANPYFDQSPSICSAGFLTVTTFGSIAGGSLLGILQIVTELRRDRWAFLIHRPVGRTTIFVGKVVGGLTLYSLAMGIPLLGAAVWAATPGSVAAPFDSRMLLPGFADVLTGTAFYFAGMLTGIRQARWYGSRALGIVAAVLCAILVLNVAKEFRHAVLAVLAFDVLLSCAAWGGFLSDGENGRQPRPVRAILGVCLFVGIAVLSAAGVAIIGAFLPGQDTWISTDYAFHRDGTVLRVTTDIHGVQEVTDLGGKEIPEYRDARARADFHRNTAQTTYIRWSDPKHGPSYRNCERWFSLLAYGQDAHWYFIEDEGLFRGFSTRDRREVGTLGPDGLASVGAEPGRRFQGRRVRT